jgi:hypothetical protein
MAATSAPAGEYLAAANRAVSAANGIDYADRQVGEGTPALAHGFLFQHHAEFARDVDAFLRE